MKYIWVIFLIVVLPSPGLGQNNNVSFEATADARQVVLGSYFEVSFTLSNGEGSNFTPPSFKDFIQLNKTPSQSTSVTGINGKWTRTVSYSYNLQPKKIGKFSIGSAKIAVEGKILRTKPISVEVVKARNSGATTQKGLDEQISDEVFIKAELNPETAYVGQQIILDYKLYTTVNIENYNILSESDYPGFYAQELRRFNSRVIREVIDGVPYSTKTLKRVALFPQQAGILTIDPIYMQLGLAIENDTRPRSFFFNRRVKPLPVQSDSVSIQIKQLPSGAPEDFTGAVGKYSINSSLSRTHLSTDDALSVRTTISGDGDIKRVQAPPLMLSDIFEVYDPKVIDETSIETGGNLTGKKVVEYLVLPQKPGQYEIRPNFSFFDPDSAKYVSINPELFTIDVSKGINKVHQVNVSPRENDIGEDIRFIKLKTDLQNNGNPFFGSVLFWILLALPVFGLASVLVFKQIQSRRAGIDIALLKRRKAIKLAKRRLAKAKKHLEKSDSRAFYNEVSHASFGYICDKLSIPFSELTKANIKDKLQQLKVNSKEIEGFMGVIETCELALFAGKDNTAAMKDTYQSTVEVIARIEAEIGK